MTVSKNTKRTATTIADVIASISYGMDLKITRAGSFTLYGDQAIVNL
jgi:hypothetical protein